MNNMDVDKVSKLLDEACVKLCKRVKPSTGLMYDEVFKNIYGNNIFLKANTLKDIMGLPWETDYYEKRVEQLETEVGYLKKQLEEKEKKNICQHALERISEMQYEEIECLRSELHQYKYPDKKDKRKNAYKATANPVQIYRDIANGMSKTEAAKKYGVSRNTIRKRYEEGREIIENEIHGK